MITVPALEHLISQYGLLAVFLGTLAEGEAILIVAGYAAQRGYLDLSAVWAMAFLGSFLSDQLIFQVGRRLGRPYLAQRPHLQRRTDRAFRLLDRYRDGFILVFRFLYGLRIASPLAIGISAVPSSRFLALNLVAAAVWAIGIGSLGYFFGQVAGAVVGDVALYERYLVVAVLAVGAVLWGLARIGRDGGRQDR